MIKRKFFPFFCAASLFLAAFVSAPLPVYAADEQEGQWALDEKGQYWVYYYGPDEPAGEGWVTEGDGKEYYVDSKGRMKTGWVKPKGESKRYYLGEDGAKQSNTFAPDGRYVAPDGSECKVYDKYRKAIKKELNSFAKDKVYKVLPEGQVLGFALTDLDRDGIKDLLVMDNVESPGRVLSAMVWDMDAQKLLSAAEADIVAEGENAGWQSWLTYNAETDSIWLVMSGPDGLDMDYFELEKNGANFRNSWHFTTDLDDWDDIVYLVDGGEADEEEWKEAHENADADAGVRLDLPLAALKEEQIDAYVDLLPSESELDMWLAAE